MLYILRIICIIITKDFVFFVGTNYSLIDYKNPNFCKICRGSGFLFAAVVRRKICVEYQFMLPAGLWRSINNSDGRWNWFLVLLVRSWPELCIDGPAGRFAGCLTGCRIIAVPLILLILEGLIDFCAYRFCTAIMRSIFSACCLTGSGLRLVGFPSNQPI